MAGSGLRWTQSVRLQRPQHDPLLWLERMAGAANASPAHQPSAARRVLGKLAWRVGPRHGLQRLLSVPD